MNVGAWMHIHALKHAGLWCEKEGRLKNCVHICNLDNQEEGDKGVKKTVKLLAKQMHREHMDECCAWRTGGQFTAKTLHKYDREPQQISI